MLEIPVLVYEAALVGDGVAELIAQAIGAVLQHLVLGKLVFALALRQSAHAQLVVEPLALDGQPSVLHAQLLVADVSLLPLRRSLSGLVELIQ